MKKKRIMSLLLCLCTLFAAAPAAFAEGDETAEIQATTEMSILNPQEMETIVNDYLTEKGIKSENIGIAFCYTATGDRWYYNGDEWFYAASLHKIPLIMLLSEKVASGEITPETVIGGVPVSQIEEYVITYSNNDLGHVIRKYLGGDEVWRADAKKYSTLTDSEYIPDYIQYCYYSPRYINDVLETLYASPDSYPNVIECMMNAEPKEYIRRYLEGVYPIAQKYGSYDEPNGTLNRHASGIVYTDNPVILTVMTKNVTNPNEIIGKLSELLVNYALTLDSKVEIFKAQKLAAEVSAQREAEEQAAAEQAAAEEAEREAAQKAEAEKKAAIDAAEKAAKAASREKRQATLKKLLKILVIVLVLVGAGIAVLSLLSTRFRSMIPSIKDIASGKKREYDDFDFDDDVMWEELPKSRSTQQTGRAKTNRAYYDDEDDEWDEPEKQPLTRQPVRRPAATGRGAGREYSNIEEMFGSNANYREGREDREERTGSSRQPAHIARGDNRAQTERNPERTAKQTVYYEEEIDYGWDDYLPPTPKSEYLEPEGNKETVRPVRITVTKRPAEDYDEDYEQPRQRSDSYSRRQNEVKRQNSYEERPVQKRGKHEL